ncbi:opacity protein-like surface antigen [Bradyrhizobium sp. RT4a]
MECFLAVRQRRRSRDEQPLQHFLDTLTGIELAAASSTRWGGTVGIGWEYGFAPNWSAGIEYDHLFMGNANNSFSVANPVIAGALNRITQDVDMVTLRVNYRVGGYGAP